MKLKLAVATMLAALFIALPFEVAFTAYDWRFDPTEYPKMVSWAGCTAEVDVDQHDSVANSYYVPGYHVMHIGARDDSDIPYFAGLIILLHETGHCLQFQADPDAQMSGYHQDPVKYELDADRRAADLACSMGLDGKQLLRDTFQWAHDVLGYEGDPSHGTLAQRMSQGDAAPACMRRVETWASM